MVDNEWTTGNKKLAYKLAYLTEKLMYSKDCVVGRERFERSTIALKVR